MKRPLRLLIVEDSEDDALLIVGELERSGFEPIVERVETAAALAAALQRTDWDVIVSDNRLPAFSGVAALQMVRATGLDIPFIIVSGTIGEEQAVEAMKQGAHDYLLKDRLGRLGTAVSHELERRHLRAENRQAQQQLLLQTTALETAANAVVITARSGEILWVNPAFTSLSGYSAAEVIGQNPRLLKSGRHDDAFYETFWKAISAGQTWRGEFTNRRKDGSLYQDEHTVTPVRDAGGGITHFIGIMHDVTARKEAEAALVESERKYRLMVDHMGECVVLLDLSLRHLFASPSVARIYGYLPEEFVALPLDRVMSPASLRVARQAFAEEMALEASGTGDPRRTRVLETLEYRKDGSAIWIGNTFSFIRDAAGQAVQILCVAKDITERKQAMLALGESQHLLEQAQAVGHIGSWVTDPGPPSRLVWSAETCRIFGVAPGRFDGRMESFTALVHPEDRDDVGRAALAALTSGLPYDLEHRIVRPDGVVRWVHEQADVECDPTGRPVRMVGVVQDITERKQLEEQLRLAQKMEAIGQLAGGIAHDFNNILGSILGNGELIKLLAPGSPEAAECLDDILIGSRRASELVGQILAFSRRQESKRLPIQLHPVVREVLKLLRATVPANVEFRAHLANAPTVLADPSELHQVTMNLCTNGWHAMHDRGGIITVKLADVQLDQAFANLHPDLRPGHYVCLTVADDGCGMDEVTLGRIFEPFFTTKPAGKGTGLGLSVVHGIVKNHDGGIVVQSQPGAGTTFQLYFPVFAAETEASAAAPHQVPRGTGEHVLFVDDEEPLARMATRALQRLGYRVTQHTRPAEALAAFRASPNDFDLIVVDYNMPGLSGTEFGVQVLEARPGQRIVLTTGFSATLTAEAVRDLGFAGMMPKPYDLNSLGQTVHRVLHATDIPQ